MLTILLIFLIITIRWGKASVGDRTPIYTGCLIQCETTTNCNQQQELLNYWLLLWDCFEECKYQCMWKTVQEFLDQQRTVPQFYGKWPFVRIFGIQEPASMVFSLLNLIVHVKMYRIFKRSTDPSWPLSWLWKTYFYVCANAWIWSAIFHTHDLPWTEYLDYASAFSIIMINAYVASIRVFQRFFYMISLIFFLIFLQHINYLRTKFDYSYNMVLNVAIGTLTALVWLIWMLRQREKYVWKIFCYVTLTGVSLLFELFDFVPLWWTFDAHALWHLTTAPLLWFVYRFAIEDCQYLHVRRLQLKNQ